MTCLRDRLIAVAVLTLAPVVLLAGESDETPLAGWAKTLEHYVDEAGRIDFTGLARDRGGLDSYIKYIAESSPQSSPAVFPDRASVLAYHINAYNALAMHGVIEKGIPDDFESIFKRLNFFKLNKVVIGGETTSLYDYENDLIRKLGEPRVHFALNCMVRDCPRLPQVPFSAENLEVQLELAAREFFSKPKHVRFDHDRKIVWLSEIMDFYTEDFTPSGTAADLIPYINRYLAEPVPPGYRVRFIDYDWTINRQPAAGG